MNRGPFLLQTRLVGTLDGQRQRACAHQEQAAAEERANQRGEASCFIEGHFVSPLVLLQATDLPVRCCTRAAGGAFEDRSTTPLADERQRRSAPNGVRIRDCNSREWGPDLGRSGFPKGALDLQCPQWVQRRRLRGARGGGLCERVNALLQASEGRGDRPLRFYWAELLFSIEARLGWVEPDSAS